MDYSLLLAVHNVDETKRQRIEERNSGIIDKTHQQLSPVSEQPSTSDSNAEAYAAATAAAAQGTLALKMNYIYNIHSIRFLCDAI